MLWSFKKAKRRRGVCVLLSYSITFCSFSSNARTQSPFVFSSYFCKKKKILTQVVCFTNFRKKQNKHSYNFFSLPDHIISLLIPSFNPVQTLKSHNMMRWETDPGQADYGCCLLQTSLVSSLQSRTATMSYMQKLIFWIAWNSIPPSLH